MEIAPTDDAIEATFEKLEKYRALSIAMADNTGDPIKRAAVYEFVQDVNERYGESPWRPFSQRGALPAQIVLQHPAALELYLRDLKDSLNLDWNYSNTFVALAASIYLPIVGVASAVYLGYQNWWKAQADPTVIREMVEVSQGKRRLGDDQVLAIRIQAPDGTDWAMMMVMAPEARVLERPEPSGLKRAFSGLKQRVLGVNRPAPPDKLQPTLIGFLHRGGINETAAATTVP